MEFDYKELEAFIDDLNARLAESRTQLDEKLGWVFYPCLNAIEKALDRSMA